MGPLRSLLSTVLVLLGLLLAAVAAPATWARENLLDTDEWTGAVTPLIAEPEIQRTVSDALVASLDPDGTLPSFARELLTRTTDAAVATETFASTWGSAVRISHEHLLEAVRDEGKGIDVSDGVVAIDLEPLFVALVPRLEEAGVPGIDLLPTPEGQVVLEDSAETARALEVAGEIDSYAWPLAVFAGILLVFGVLTARSRGRSLLVVGAGLVVVAAVELAAWMILESRWVDAGGDPSGQLVLQALTDSVQGWLTTLGAVGVVVFVLGLVVVWISRMRSTPVEGAGAAT